MPEVTIDGKTVEVSPGTNVVEAAKQVGIEIPVFCYHPGLPPDGNCRMCTIKTEEAGLTPACITECRDGMTVRTDTEEVKDAQEGVLEFLLLNHPLDCPICDKSGECMLQDHYFEYSAQPSRMEHEKVQKRKVIDVGPEIVLDTERCILCSRCVRFCNEIAEEPSLGIVNRGDHAELTTFPGKELDNPYSLNTVDICPVGALTSKKFRFRKRVWFLDETSSVCPNCARGCNVKIEHEDGEISRMMPEHNPEVNDYWLCDEGRQTFDFVDSASRLTTPKTSQNSDPFQEITWETVREELNERISSVREQQNGVAALLSPRATNEENLFAVRTLFEQFEAPEISYLGHHHGWIQNDYQDDILIRKDKNPNRFACKLLKDHFDLPSEQEWIENVEEQSPALLFVFEPLIQRRSRHQKRLNQILQNTETVIYIGTHHVLNPEEAEWLLPGKTWAEKEGTFTNFEGRIQHFSPAISGPDTSKTVLNIIADLFPQNDADHQHIFPQELFQQYSESILDQKYTYEDLKPNGLVPNYEEAGISV